MSSAVTFTKDGAFQTFDDKVTKYKLRYGIYFHEETPDVVAAILAGCRERRQRIRVHYGEQADGRDWWEENDVEGYVGCSTGPLKIPLLVYNRRSMGGGHLLDHHIVRIRETGKKGRELWQAENYQQGEFVIRQIVPTEKCGKVVLTDAGYKFAVDVYGENHANFKSEKEAKRWVKKMTGNVSSKLSWATTQLQSIRS